MIIVKNKTKNTPIYIMRNGNVDSVGGNNTTDVDLSDYYTKDEVDEAIANVEVDLTGYATEGWVNDNYQTKGDYLTEIPDEYVTDSELSNKGYATEDYVDNKVDNIVIPDSSNIVSLTTAEYEELVNNGEVDSDTMYLITDAEISANFKTINGESILGDGNIEITGGGSVDLSDYYTKTEIDGKGYITSIPDEYVTETELSAKNYLTSIPDEYVTDSELNAKEYATESWVNTQIANQVGNINNALENLIG